MIESPLLQEIFAEERQQARREATLHSLLILLTSRFGSEAAELEADLKAIEDGDRLMELIKLSASCRSLKSFSKQVSP
jgi:hypothetical protein